MFKTVELNRTTLRT